MIACGVPIETPTVMEMAVNRFMVLGGLGALAILTSLENRLLAEMPRSTGPVLATSTVTAPTIQWHEDLNSGWRESRRRNVPMVIFITSDHCSYCDAMKRDTWCDGSIRTRIAGGFVAIRLNPRRNAATLSRIRVKMYPTTLVGLPQGKVVGHRLGYRPPAALHQLLSDVKK